MIFLRTNRKYDLPFMYEKIIIESDSLICKNRVIVGTKE
jgi:hypothetical protein